jgi:hypothetical protein
MARSLGRVDLLGLDNFGKWGLNPIWGAVIGGGVAGVTTIAARHSSNATLMGYPEVVGLGAGLATAGAMYAMKTTRHAALGAAVGAVLASGIAYLEKILLGSVTVAPATAAVAVQSGGAVPAGTPSQAGVTGMRGGFGIPNVRALNGLGIPNMRALNGGLGVPMMQQRSTPAGAIPGVAGNQLSASGVSSPPVSLLGPRSPQAAHLLGIGGPAVHGLSAAYGATLLGGGR